MSTPERKEWVTKIFKYALDNYEKNGWDYLVETYSPAEVEFEIEDCKTYDAAFKRIERLMCLLDSQRKEIKSTEF